MTQRRIKRLQARNAAQGFIILLMILSGCQGRDKALYDSAQDHWLKDEYVEAVDKFRLITAEYPDSKLASMALFRLGEIHYLNLDDPARALDYFSKVVEREDKSSLTLRAYKYIAEIYERSLGDHDLAILQYQKILSEFSDSVKPDAYRYLIAKAYFNKHEYAQAIIEYQTLLHEYPKSDLALDARYQVANSRLINGEPEKAIVLLKRLLEDYPGNKYLYDIYLSIASAYEDMDQLKEALGVYETMKREFPDKELVDRKIDSLNRRQSMRKR